MEIDNDQSLALGVKDLLLQPGHEMQNISKIMFVSLF